MTHDPLLRPKDAAARIGVSPETVRRWIRKRAIPHVRVGTSERKGLRVRQSVIDAQREDVQAGGDCST